MRIRPGTAVGIGLLAIGCAGFASKAEANGKYDSSTGLFHLTYSFARLPNGVATAEQLLSAEEPATAELDALVKKFYQSVSEDLGRVTSGRGYLAPPVYTRDIVKADILISPDTTFTPNGQVSGGWGILNGFSNNSGQLAIYIPSLKQGFTSTNQRLTVVHELCHYLFGLPDEYGAQGGCPAPGEPGCLMGNYNARSWPGYLCNDSNFRHNDGAVGRRDPKNEVTKSCQTLVNEFFKSRNIDENTRFPSPTGGEPVAGGAAAGAADPALDQRIREKARLIYNEEKGRGEESNKRKLLARVKSAVYDLIKASGRAIKDNPGLLEDVAKVALESLGVPPAIPETLKLLAPLLEKEARRMGQALANKPGGNGEILAGLLKLAKNPGAGFSPATVRDDEYAYLKTLSRQAAITQGVSGAVDPGVANLRYLDQISAKLDALLIRDDIPGAIEARDLSRKLQRDLVRGGMAADDPRDDPFKKARGTMVIAPPITGATLPGLGLDLVLVHPGELQDYNNIRYACVKQFNALIDRERVQSVFGVEQGDLADSGNLSRTNRFADYREQVLKDKQGAADSYDAAAQKIREGRQDALVRARTRRIVGLVELVYKEIRKDSIQNVAVLVPPGGLPEALSTKLRMLRAEVVGHTDVRLDVVQVGTAPIPPELRDLSARSGGAVLTVTDSDEVGAVSQRIANEQSQGTWVNLPLQGTIHVDPPPVAGNQGNNTGGYALFQRMAKDRSEYTYKKATDTEARFALRSFYVDAASSYQFVVGFSRALNVPTDDSPPEASDVKPEIRLIKERIHENDKEARDKLRLNAQGRESPSLSVMADMVTYQPSRSRNNVLVFDMPPASKLGIEEGWYTPILVLKKPNFDRLTSKDSMDFVAQGTEDASPERINFTCSIGAPRSNAQLIPRLIQPEPADPKERDLPYMGTIEKSEQAVIQAQMIVGAPVKNAKVVGYYEKVDYSTSPIGFTQLARDLKDDGQPPDKVKDDGIYTGIVPLGEYASRSPAEYRVVITAEHQDGTSFIDLTESLPADPATRAEQDKFKGIEVPRFQRSTSLNIRVEGRLPAPAAVPNADGAKYLKALALRFSDALKKAEPKLVSKADQILAETNEMRKTIEALRQSLEELKKAQAAPPGASTPSGDPKEKAKE